ncbi:MAG: cysteine synthase A [Clostridia bacterium]|nr:cysteine synthase A [Clostridia bacterium]
MSKIYTSIDMLIGETPLLELKNLVRKNALHARILGKLECCNPAGSVKDRAAKAMLDEAEQKGLIGEASVIIEPTSGNTGVALAAVAAARGYRTIIVMPDTMSKERRLLMSAYGAKVVLSPGTEGMAGAVAAARKIAAETPHSFIPGQFENPANARAHFETTAPEIWRDTDGEIDIFVAGVGTGGTISGAGEYLKAQKASLKVVAVEPASSPLLSEGRAGGHKIQGIGANFVPELLNTNIYDEVMSVKDEDALLATRELARTEGIMAGISSGAAIWAAVELAKRSESADKTIVAILPDSGTRYLSTGVFDA